MGTAPALENDIELLRPVPGLGELPPLGERPGELRRARPGEVVTVELHACLGCYGPTN